MDVRIVTQPSAPDTIPVIERRDRNVYILGAGFSAPAVLDSALSRVGVHADYGLEGVLADELDVQLRTCSVFKLYGSTNWGLCGSCREGLRILSGKVTDSPNASRANQFPDPSWWRRGTKIDRIRKRKEEARQSAIIIPDSW